MTMLKRVFLIVYSIIFVNALVLFINNARNDADLTLFLIQSLTIIFSIAGMIHNIGNEKIVTRLFTIFTRLTQITFIGVVIIALCNLVWLQDSYLIYILLIFKGVSSILEIRKTIREASKLEK